MRASASVTFLYGSEACHEVVTSAARAGFEALEFQVVDIAMAAAYAPHLAEGGLDVALVNMSVGDFASGGRGLSAVAANTDAFKAALEEVAEIVETLRPGVVHIGPSRLSAGARREEGLEVLEANVRLALERLSGLGCKVSVEVLNSRDFPGLVVDTLECAVNLVERVDNERFVLQYDLYHAAMDQRDLVRDLRSMGELIGHVQVADFPGRREPGSGSLDLAECFATLSDIGYGGYVGAEYHPTTTPEATAGWIQQFRTLPERQR